MTLCQVDDCERGDAANENKLKTVVRKLKELNGGKELLDEMITQPDPQG